MSRTTIAIIGGGLAGLQAARLLQQANVDFVLLEARKRLGGRILTVDEDGTPTADGFDLGPSWYWPANQPAIAALIAELGLATFPQASDGDVIFERMAREGPQRYAAMEQPALSFRLAGGTGALIEALVRDVPASRLWRGSVVSAVALESDGVVLTVHRDGAPPERLYADRVIAALPPRLLAETVTFTPALDADTATRWRDTPTWMAPHAKCFALYDRPFWREAGLSGTAQSMVGPMPEIHDATTASGKAALFGFVGVPAAQRAAMGEQALKDACVAQLVRLFGAEAKRPRATLLKDWARDPYTATARDHPSGGHPMPNAAPWVQGAWLQRLVLAGSETSPEEPGYLAGAVIAAARAVARLT